jgi:ParB/RepB/Spo0J family partition protein
MTTRTKRERKPAATGAFAQQLDNASPEATLPVPDVGMWSPLPIPAATGAAPSEDRPLDGTPGPVPAGTNVREAALHWIPIARTYESDLNPRTRYDEPALADLANSLLANGQWTPILVRPVPTRINRPGGWEIGAGHRRRRAALIALRQDPVRARAQGLDRLLAIVRDLDDVAFVELLNVENLQRDGLHPLEEAQGFRTLLERAGYDIPKLAERLGRTTHWIYDSLTLLKLIGPAKKLFLANRFSRAHAIELARLAPTDQGRAIGRNDDARWGRVGGLFQVEQAGDDEELDLGERGGAVKAVSVREFKRYVDEHVRFQPAQADPMLFPETVARLDVAAQTKERVVEITFEYQTPNAVRGSAGPKIVCAPSWRSATKGISDPVYHGKDGRPCEHAITGVVVIGERRGEAFKVCLAKETCTTHWADLRKERAARAKGKTNRPSKASRQAETDYAAQRAREDAEHARWKKAATAIRHEIEAKVREATVTPTSPVVRIAFPSTTIPKAKDLADLIRQVALGKVRDQLNWGIGHNGPRLGKLFGVDVRKIRDRVAPAAKPTAKKPAKKGPKKAKAKAKGGAR